MAIRSGMVSNVRLLIGDTDTSVSASFTDAQITTFINLALRWLYENYEKRVKYVTLIADFDSGVYQKDGDSGVTYPEILEVYLVLNSVDTPLERLEWADIRYRQSSGAFAETGTPTYYAAVKYGGAAVGSGLQNLWKFAFYPINDTDNAVVKGLVRAEPVALSADADIVDLNDFEAQLAEIIAAIFAAPRHGRPELAQDLMGLLPKMLQDKLATHMSRDEVVS